MKGSRFGAENDDEAAPMAGLVNAEYFEDFAGDGVPGGSFSTVSRRSIKMENGAGAYRSTHHHTR